MLDALVIVHSLGVLHRDIAPDNIYMCSDGNIKLIDFGAARQVVGEESKSLSIILKTGFAPLEQYQKKGNQGPWTDIYALGASLYYAVTGIVVDDAMSRLEDPALRLEGVSPALAGIISKMLAVKIEERYKSAVELKADIERFHLPQTPPKIDAIQDKPSFCIYCGKALTGGAEICDDCRKANVENGVLVPSDGPEKLKVTQNGKAKKEKKSKKWIIPVIIGGALIIAGIVAFLLIFNNASAKLIGSGDCGASLKWTFSEDGVLTISGRGDMYDYLVDETDSVALSTAPWSEHAGSISEIILEEGVEYIGDFAFVACGVSEIVMPSTMEYIGDCAFAYCQGLKKVELNDAIWAIGEGAFYNDMKIKTIDIPENVSWVEAEAFSGWTEGQQIVINATEDYVYENWQYGWDEGCYAKLSYLSSGEHTHIFGDLMNEDEHPHYEYRECTTCGYLEYTGNTIPFYSCEDCGTKGVCGDDLVWELANDDTLYITGSGAMYDYDFTNDILTTPWAQYVDYVSAVKIDEGVTTIGDYAFALCALEEVELPSTVWQIGYYSFALCEKLEYIDLANVEEIYANSFYGDNALKLITIPECVEYVDMSVFSGFISKQTICVEASEDFVDSYWHADWDAECEANIVYLSDSHDVATSVTNNDTANSTTTTMSTAHTHYWGAVQYEPAHPHNGYHVCSTCGASEYVGYTSALSACITCYPPTYSHTHTWGSVEYEPAHPHNGYHTCSTCGANEYVGYTTTLSTCMTCYPPTQTHTHSWGSIKYEPAHPHKGYHTCSCGASEYVGTTTTLSACMTCYPPAQTHTHTWGQTEYESEHPHKGYHVCSSCGVNEYTGTNTISRLCNICKPQDSASYIDTGKCGDDISWTLDESGNLTISGSGKMYDFDANPPWYAHRDVIKSVSVKYGVKDIGKQAFYRCYAIANVDLPGSVTTIGESAFYECTSLASIKIPYGTTTIGSYSFNGCSSLVSVDMPDTVKTIGVSAFENCTSLANIRIPGTVRTISKYAFSYCTSLQNITIPAGVTNVGYGAFYNWTSQQTINVEATKEYTKSNWHKDWTKFCYAKTIYNG